MPRKKGNKPMLPTSPATPLVAPQAIPVAQPLEKTQKLQHEFQVLLSNLMARAQELGISISFGNKKGCASFDLDGLQVTGSIDPDKKIGVIFLPHVLFKVGEDVTSPDGLVKIIAYNGRSQSGLPEYTGQSHTSGIADIYQQDQLKRV